MSEETLFHEALTKSTPAERKAFLDEACAGRPELRAAIEALLAAHDASGDFLDRPAHAPVEATGEYTPDPEASPPRPTADYHPAIEPGGVIAGRYTLVEKLGEGGMGEVWVAKQTEPVKRKVALKLIKAGMDSKAVLTRFEQERQALALMDHPNIAKVLDGGLTSDRRPFFVMELVNGLPLTKFCDEAKLTPRQRLELFVPICQAVQHAHQKGIVHRDLKPTNILVTLYDGTPTPKVIDFGVAKAVAGKLTDESLSTQFGAVIGTLEYMAPEQAGFSAADVDTRADIYSLGMILYELLTGLRPFDALRLRKAALDELIRIIREEEPSKPSTRLSTDEALPSLAALRQTEPKRLMALLRGELDCVIMKALEKDRNRRYETANALGRDIQRFLADEPIEAQPPSVRYRFGKFLKRNRGAVLTTTAIACLLMVGLFTATAAIIWYQNEEGKRALADGVRKADEEHKKAQRDAIAQREIEERARTVRAALQEAEGLRKQQKWADAREAVQRARGRLAGAGPADLLWSVERAWKDLNLVASLEEIRLQQSQTRKGEWDFTSSDPAYAAAFQSYDLPLTLDVVETAQRIRASAIRDQLVAAVDDWIWVKFKADPAGQERLLAVAQRADDDPWRRRLRDPKVWKDRAALQQLAAQPELLAQPPTTVIMLSIFLEEIDAVPDAVKLLRQAQQRHPGDFWINAELAIKLCNLKPARTDEALGFARAALAIRPRSPGTYVHMGAILAKLGRDDEAVLAYNAAIALDPDSAAAHNNLSLSLRKLGHLAAAAKAARKSIELKAEAPAYSNLGMVLIDLDQLDEAVFNLNKAIELRPKAPLPYCNLSVALSKQEKYKEALDACRQALKLDPEFVEAYVNLGIVLCKQGKPRDALTALETAIKLAPDNATAYTNLSATLYLLGEFEKALPNSRKALELNPKHAGAWAGLGHVLARLEKLDDAVAAYQKAITLAPKLAEAHGGLSVVFALQQKLEDSMVAGREAVRLDPRDGRHHGNLAQSLLRRGYLAEARTHLLKANELLAPTEPMRPQLLMTLKLIEPLAALDARLLAVLDGKAEPADNAERLKLADLCQFKKLHRAGADLFGKAMKVDRKVADDLNAWHRYNAACCAALAGCRQGKDADNLTETERAELRKQAIDWLRADLVLYEKLLSKDPAFVVQRMDHWQKDADFIGVRDVSKAAKLPALEQAAWQKLWSDVRQLRKHAQSQFTETRFDGVLSAKEKSIVYGVKLSAGKTYVIDMQSNVFDTYLKLEDSQGKLLAENDDINPPTNLNSQIVFTPQQSGAYRIVATSYQQQGRGAYEIIVREFGGTENLPEQ